MLLKDKVVIITGASSEFGKETASLFAKESAGVVAVSRLRILQMQHCF